MGTRGSDKTMQGRTSGPTKSLPTDARPRNRMLLLQALLSDGPQSRADTPPDTAVYAVSYIEVMAPARAASVAPAVAPPAVPAVIKCCGWASSRI